MSDLIFKELRIQNFRSFSGRHKFQFDRSPGLYFVSGQNKLEPDLGSNGSGKSTLLQEAPYWCLTGKTLRIQRAGSSVESRNLKGTTKVQLLIEKDSNRYQISRSRNPNQLLLNDSIVEQKVINDLIGLSDEALIRTLFVTQFGSLFLDLRSEEQSRLFTEILNLDLWLKASKVANDLQSLSEKDLIELQKEQSFLEGRRDELLLRFNEEKELSSNFEKEKKDKLDLLKENLRTEIQIQNRLQRSLASFPDDTHNASLESEINDARASHANLAQDLTRRESGFANVARDESRLKAVIERYSKADKRCPECNQEVSDQHIEDKKSMYVNDLEILQKNQSELASGIFELQEKVEISNELVSKLEEQKLIQKEIEKGYRDVYLKVGLQNSKVQTIEQLIEQTNKLVNIHQQSVTDLRIRYNKAKKELQELEANIKGTEYEIGIYKYWSTSYKEIRLSLIDEVLQELEITTNRHVNSLGLHGWEAKYSTERQTVSGSISHKFSVFLYPPGQQNPIDYLTYSGGESQRWQLAITFALSEVLLSRAGISPNIEILDEPTAHLSESGINDLLNCLKERAIDTNRCIYFIDHKSIDSGYFDGFVKIEKTESGSKILTH